MGPWEAYKEQGPWTKFAAPPPAANMFDAVQSSNPVARTGYAAQVRATMSGDKHPETIAPARSLSEIGASYGKIGKGLAVGAAGAAPGWTGDLEGAGRGALRAVGVPGVDQTTVAPTTTGTENALAGPSQSPEESFGRAGGELVGPLAGLKALKYGLKGAGWLGSKVLGLTTGAGSPAISEAAKAGREGGAAAEAFQSQLRGNAPVEDVVASAKKAVEQLRADRSTYYQQNLGTTFKNDKQILDFAPIDKALADTAKIGTYNGKTISEGAKKAWDEISNVVEDWRKSDPAQFHTPAGFDALKQKIGNLAYEENLKGVTGPGTPGNAIVKKVYGAIKGQIAGQSPGYEKAMADYSSASDTLKEVEKGFSLNNKATVDTALRKLQSIMRNNANTNYGQRAAMGDVLHEAGNGTLKPALAGQALSSWEPRGLQRLAAGGEALATLHPATLPYAVPALVASSPRVVGEGAYYAGKASRVVPQVGNLSPAQLFALQIARQNQSQQPSFASPPWLDGLKAGMARVR